MLGGDVTRHVSICVCVLVFCALEGLRYHQLSYRQEHLEPNFWFFECFFEGLFLKLLSQTVDFPEKDCNVCARKRDKLSGSVWR